MKNRVRSFIAISVLLLFLCSCGQSAARDTADTVDTTDAEISSAPQESSDLDLPVPLDCFTTLGCDKKNLYTMTAGQCAELAALLQSDTWEPIEDPLDVTYTALLQAKTDDGYSLDISQRDDGQTLVLIYNTDKTDQHLYSAPAQVAEDAKAFYDRFGGTVIEVSEPPENAESEDGQSADIADLQKSRDEAQKRLEEITAQIQSTTSDKNTDEANGGGAALSQEGLEKAVEEAEKRLQEGTVSQAGSPASGTSIEDIEKARDEAEKDFHAATEALQEHLKNS